MPAIHKNKIYKPIETGNPFRDGQDAAYADILLDKMKETRRWRNIGAASLALFGVSIGLFWYALKLQKTVPVLINVMPSGETRYLGEVRQSETPPVPEAAIVYQIRSFITSLRTVSTDYQIVYNNIDDCYQMVTQGYSQLMTRMLRENSPFELAGKIRRSIEIETVLKITGRSYQIDWIETVVDSSAGRSTARMRAVVSVLLLRATEQTIKRNPLGIYIESCEMTEL